MAHTLASLGGSLDEYMYESFLKKICGADYIAIGIIWRSINQMGIPLSSISCYMIEIEKIPASESTIQN